MGRGLPAKAEAKPSARDLRTLLVFQSARQCLRADRQDSGRWDPEKRLSRRAGSKALTYDTSFRHKTPVRTLALLNSVDDAGAVGLLQTRLRATRSFQVGLTDLYDAGHLRCKPAMCRTATGIATLPS